MGKRPKQTEEQRVAQRVKDAERRKAEEDAARWEAEAAERRAAVARERAAVAANAAWEAHTAAYYALRAARRFARHAEHAIVFAEQRAREIAERQRVLEAERLQRLAAAKRARSEEVERNRVARVRADRAREAEAERRVRAARDAAAVSMHVARRTAYATRFEHRCVRSLQAWVRYRQARARASWLDRLRSLRRAARLYHVNILTCLQNKFRVGVAKAEFAKRLVIREFVTAIDEAGGALVLRMQARARGNGARRRLRAHGARVGRDRLLAEAAESGNLLEVRHLLKLGAAAETRAHVPSWVLSRRPTPPKPSAYARIAAACGATPLYIAARCGHLDVVHELLAAGAMVDTKCGNVAKLDAKKLPNAKRGGKRGLQRAVKKAATMSALSAAAALGAADAGGSPQQPSWQREPSDTAKRAAHAVGAAALGPETASATPFYAACEFGHTEVARYLYEQGANVESRALSACGYGLVTPFWVACQNGHEQVVRFLLSLNDDVAWGEDAGASSVGGNGDAHSVRAAPSAPGTANRVKATSGGSSTRSGTGGRQQLPWHRKHRAAPGHGAKAPVLPVDIEARDIRGATPYFVACEEGRVELVRVLVEDITRPGGGPDGETRVPRVDCVARTRAGEWPYLAACRRFHYQVAAWLFDRRLNGGALHPTEAQFLDELYFLTDGEHWTNQAGWDRRRDRPEGCFGIKLNEHRRVSHVVLSGNNLRGPIPSLIGHCKYMRVLRLDFNDLVGEIPAAIGGDSTCFGCRELRVLGLSGNNLEGVVPDELLQCTKLEKFFLANNPLMSVEVLNHTQTRLKEFFMGRLRLVL